MQLSGGTQITWLGHACFKIATPGGKVLMIDPWVNNPSCPEDKKKIDRVEVIAVSHGHFDHIGDCVELATQHHSKVVCIYEESAWLEKQGVQVVGMNKGGTAEVEGLKFTMVGADHSCGILDGDNLVYGGEPCGWVIELEDGYRIYHAGDTNVFTDMRIIGELYKPRVAMLPIGGFYTMGPREAAYAARLLGVPAVIPMHYGTFPALAGTPAELRDYTKDLHGFEVVEMQPGQTLG